jgi:hypothetical protein
MIRKPIPLILAAIWALTGGVCSGEDYKNYEVTINGKTYGLNLDEAIQIKDEEGNEIEILLRKKPYTEYSDQFVSFQLRSELNVSAQDLGNGITQLMSATATGTLIMIQEYSDMNPSMLVPMMLKELTKESVEYGHKMTQEKITRKLKSGATLKGLKAILRYKGEETSWEVLGYGKKDTGILVITQIDKEFFQTDKKLHERFWNTLDLKF